MQKAVESAQKKVKWLDTDSEYSSDEENRFKDRFIGKTDLDKEFMEIK